MDLQIIDGKRFIVCTVTSCTCMNGKLYGRVPCPTCGGTARTKGGKGKGRCRKCFDGKIVSTDVLVVCSRCNGSYEVKETLYNSTPAEIWRSLDFKVNRADRGITWNESFLGVGCVWSSCDYGRAAAMSDEGVIAKIKEYDSAVQAISFCCPVEGSSRVGLVADYIGIFISREGYSVRPVFNGDVDSVIRQIKSEPSEEMGRVIGAVVHSLGGNGVLAAAGKLV